MLDVCHPHERGLGRSRYPDRIAVERALDPSCHDRVLLAVALVAHQLLAQVCIDGWVGAATRRASQRDRADALTLAAHEQLGTGGHQRGIATPDAEDKTRRESVAQHAEEGSRMVCTRGGHVDLP